MFVAVVALYAAAVQRGYGDERVRSVTFAALVVSNLGLIVVNRSWRLPVWRVVVERSNPTMKWILGTTAGVLVMVLSVGSIREAFGFDALSPGDVALVIVAAAMGVGWFEVLKVISSGRRRRAESDDTPMGAAPLS